MVPPSGKELNDLFEELERWEHQLKHSEFKDIINFEGPEL